MWIDIEYKHHKHMMSEDYIVAALVVSGVALILAMFGCGAKYFCGKRRSSDEEQGGGPGYNVAMQNRLFKVNMFRDTVLWLWIKHKTNK